MSQMMFVFSSSSALSPSGGLYPRMHGQETEGWSLELEAAMLAPSQASVTSVPQVTFPGLWEGLVNVVCLHPL